MEVELKLRGPRSKLRAAFAGMSKGRHSTRRLVSTYYDTSESDVWRRGFTLRLRERPQRNELTLKQECGGGLKRGEWTSKVKGRRVDIRMLPAGSPFAAISDLERMQFVPKFHTDILREQIKLKTDGAVMEVSLDNGRIVADCREMHVDELEFELLKGPVEELLALVRSTMQSGNLFLGTSSKALRGMELAAATVPRATKAARLRLRRSDSGGEALAKVLGITVAQMIGNVSVAAGGDAEGVHQLRVSLRRLRSTLLIFDGYLGRASNELDAQARKALRRLGPVRDNDVFLTETLPPLVEAYPNERGLLRLREIAQARRKQLYEEVRWLVENSGFNLLVLDLLIIAQAGRPVRMGSDERVISTAHRFLSESYLRVKRAGSGFSRLDMSQRHRVRIALKKLRYGCDYFRGLFPKSAAKPYIKRLAALQDELGRLNDAAVTYEIVQRLATGEKDTKVGANLVMEWCDRRLGTSEGPLRSAWKGFAKATPFW